VPRNIIIDRCYVHGFPNEEIKRGIGLNSAETWVLHSYISDFHKVGQDSQEIGGWNGPGPFHIIDNYLEAAGENLLFGGARVSIQNLIPSNIEILRNTMFKQLSWKGGSPHWSIKNILELKNAQRVRIEGNLFENCWTDGQNGYPIVMTARGEYGYNPWNKVENVTLTNNVIRNATGGVNLSGPDDESGPSSGARNITISNNLFDQLTGGLSLFQFHGIDTLRIDHNTAIHDYDYFQAYAVSSPNFTFTNNIVEYNAYGSAGSDLVPGATIHHNKIVGGGSDQPATLSSVGFSDLANHNYRLASASPYKGTGVNGTDPGTDFDALQAAMSGSSPTPTPTSTPTPTPTPTGSFIISGHTYYAGDHSLLAYIFIDLLDAQGTLIDSKQEQSDAKFSFSVPAGTYFVRYNSTASPEWLSNPNQCQLLNVGQNCDTLDFVIGSPTYFPPGGTVIKDLSAPSSSYNSVAQLTMLRRERAKP
jgi:hypothetical protein